MIRFCYLVHLCHYLIVEISVAIFVINSSIFLNKFYFWSIRLFTNFTFLITVNINENSVKSPESPATSSHTIYNHSFQNIVYKIRIHKIIKINSAINIGLPERLLKILTNPTPANGWQLIIVKDHLKGETTALHGTKLFPNTVTKSETMLPE